jgi:hypothetical protein
LGGLSSLQTFFVLICFYATFSDEAMKSLIELYKESTDTKSEINILISESNDPGNALERRLLLLAEITALHQKLNGILHEIKQRRMKQLH